MDWLSIAGSALVGGIGGALGAYISSKIIPSEKKNAKSIRQVITIGTVVVTSLLWGYIIKPMVILSDDRSDVENMIMETGVRQVFSAMKKYDIVTYNKLIDELTTMIKSKNITHQEVIATSMKLGQAATLKYYTNAPADDLYHYVKKYTEYLTKKYAEKPLILCKLENPGVYGTPNTDMIADMENFGLFRSMETIIKNSMEHPTGYDKESAQSTFNAYIMEYRTTYPEHIQTLSITTELTTPENVKKFAAAYLDLYRELVKLHPEKCAGIYKYMKNMK
ncbi:MAG: hypothetical protein U0264_16965 [Candidatus Kapaibacterium sp.]